MSTLTSAPYAPRSITSRAASRAIREASTPLCLRVLTEIRSKTIHGCTRDELERDLEIKGNTLRPRVKALLDAGLVVLSDEQRRTASGCAAEVLIAKEWA